MFGAFAYEFGAFVEDDLLVSTALPQYWLEVAIPAMRIDPTLYCASGWNDNSFDATAVRAYPHAPRFSFKEATETGAHGLSFQSSEGVRALVAQAAHWTERWHPDRPTVCEYRHMLPFPSCTRRPHCCM